MPVYDATKKGGRCSIGKTFVLRGWRGEGLNELSVPYVEWLLLYWSFTVQFYYSNDRKNHVVLLYRVFVCLAETTCSLRAPVWRTTTLTARRAQASVTSTPILTRTRVSSAMEIVSCPTSTAVSNSRTSQYTLSSPPLGRPIAQPLRTLAVDSAHQPVSYWI